MYEHLVNTDLCIYTTAGGEYKDSLSLWIETFHEKHLFVEKERRSL